MAKDARGANRVRGRSAGRVWPGGCRKDEKEF